MNENLIDLYEAAVSWTLLVVDESGRYQGKEFQHVVNAKFADLIVNACMDIVWNSDEEHFDNPPASEIILEMKNYFGVE